MKTRSALLLFFLLALVVSPSVAQTDAGFVVVVHADNPTRELDTKTIERMFFKKWPRWEDDVVVVPVNQRLDSPVRDAFTRGVNGKEVSAIANYWQRQIFSGRDVPPPELANDQEVLDFVRANRGAIGYVSPSAVLGGGVRALTISGPLREVAETKVDEPQRPAALAFAIDPHDPDVLYAAFTGRGLHKSLDGGATWAQEGGGLRSHTIRAIATDLNRQGLVYVGGDEGLDRSLDGARTFTPVSAVPADVIRVRLDRTSALYVEARGWGLRRSDDGGASFVDLGPALSRTLTGNPGSEPAPGLTAFEIDPSDGRLLAAAGPVVLESGNRGVTWRVLGRVDDSVRDLAADSTEPGTLYAATRKGIFRSLDGGRRWNLTTLEEDVRSLALAPPALFAVAESGIWRSLDAGKSWERLLENPAEIVIVDRLNPGRIFAASYGQVWRTYDQGTSWRGYHFSFRESKPEVFAGRPKEKPPPIPLLLRHGEDGDHVTAIVFDPEKPEILYAAARHGVWKSTDDGRTWKHASVGLELLDVHALVIDPREPSTLYAGTHGAGVFKSTDGAVSWIEARRGLTDLVVRALALDRSLPSTLYAATRLGLFASTDAGASWKELVAVHRPDDLTYVEDVRALAFDDRYGLQVTAGTEVGTFYAGDAAAETATLAPGRLTVDAGRAEAGCRTSARRGGGCLAGLGIDPGALAPRHLTFLPRSTTGLAATAFGLWTGPAAPEGGTWTPLGLSTNVSAVLASGDEVWAAAVNGLWRSSNEGFSWIQTSVRFPAYSLAVQPDRAAIFAGLDGVVYRHPLRFEAEKRERKMDLPPLPEGTGETFEGHRIRLPEEVTTTALELWNRIRKTPPHRIRLRLLLAAELAGRGPAEHTELLRKLLITSLQALYRRDDAIREVGFSPDSRWLQTSFLLDDDRRIHSEMRLYDLDSAPTSPDGLRPDVLHWVELHDVASEPEHLRPRWVLSDAGPVLAWSGDGRYVATHAGLDLVRVSSLAPPIAGEVSPPPRAPAAHHFAVDVPAGVTAAAVASDGRSFAVAGPQGVDAVVHLAWMQAAEPRLESFVLEGTPAYPARFTHLVFIPRRRLLLFDQDGVVRMWRGKGEPVEFHRATDAFRTVELTPNLRWLTGMTEDELLLWRIHGREILPPEVVVGQPRGFLMSPGGAWLLVRDGGRLRLFDLRKGELGPSVLQTEDVGIALFSRGGESLLIRDEDVVTVYDLTKEPIRPKLSGAGRPFGWVPSKTVSRDLRWTVKAEGIDVDLWDRGEVRRRGARLRTGRFGPVGIHNDLPFTKRPHPLPGLPEDGLEKLSLVALRNFACDVVKRNLSQEEWAAYLGDEPYQETCEVKKKKGIVQRPEDG